MTSATPGGLRASERGRSEVFWCGKGKLLWPRRSGVDQDGAVGRRGGNGLHCVAPQTRTSHEAASGVRRREESQNGTDAAVALYKVGILLFNLVPFIALLL